MSKKEENENYNKLSTANIVKESLNNPIGFIKTYFNNDFENFKFTKESKSKQVLEALEWFQKQLINSSYMNNIDVIIKNDIVSWHNIPILVSLMGIWKKSFNIVKTSISNYIGSIGEKIKIKVTVNECAPYKSLHQYRATWRIKMIDENGNILLWWASNKDDRIIPGNKINIKGRIKNHSEYKNIKQTIVSHVKIIEEN